MSCAKFISHPDFSELEPLNVYHKEIDENGKDAFDRHDPEEPLLKNHPKELYNKHIIFRKKANLESFKNAIVKVAADDYYKLYINGKYVAEGAAPGYHSSYYYNEIDVTDYIKEGDNTFALHTYYQGYINRVWVSGDLREMMWLELSLDGKASLVSDESWRVNYHTGYTDCGLFGYETNVAECYDASAPEAKFYEPDFDDSYFLTAKENTKGGWNLVKQKTRLIDVYDMIPERIEKIDGGVRLYMPTEAVGLLSLKAIGKKGDEVILRYGEELCEDGSVRFEMRCNCRYEEKMILSGKDDLLVQYDYKAFRYAEILYPDSVAVSDIKMRVRHYPFTDNFVPSESDEKLRPVLDLCRNTVKYSTQERFLDCPTREKGAYLGDLMVSGRAHVAVTGDTTLIKHAIENFCDSSFICEGIMATCCCSLMQEIADYSLEFPSILNWIYSVDGDLDFIKKCEPYATGVYNYYKKYENEDGLLDRVFEWNLVDWPSNLRDNYDFPLTRPVDYGIHNVINALWYGLKLSLEELYKTLGIERNLNTEKTLSSFKKAFYNEELGLFVDAPGSMHSAVHSSVFPLLFNIGTEDEALKARLVNQIKNKKLTSMGVYMAYFTLAALKLAGEKELCIELATDEGAWLNMIKEGATLTYEAWGKDQKWNTSLCHPWATAPAIIFTDKVRPF